MTAQPTSPRPSPEERGNSEPHPSPLLEERGNSEPHPGPLLEERGNSEPHPGPLLEERENSAPFSLSSGEGRGEVLLGWWEVAILALAAFLRFWRIGQSSLWSDEGNTWALIQRSSRQIVAAAAADIHPPGYYLLLKAWSIPFGTSADAMRAFSAICGVFLVWVIARIAVQVAPAGVSRRWFPLLAALIAAVNPFQIYYSQEARMYMLLALASALLVWGLLLLLRAESQPAATWRTCAPGLILYTLAAIAGLWTHYSFPIVLLAAGIAWLVWWLFNGHTGAAFLRFALANLLALLVFAPWMPIAVRQLTTWPQGGESTSLLEGMTLTLRTLLLGLMHYLPEPSWLWLGVAAVLPVVGIVALRRSRGVVTLALWLLLPVGMMAAFGLFTDAFLKFLIVASAPWCVLLAASSEVAGARVATWLRWLVAIGAVTFAALSLPYYWNDVNARDNYAGVARYVHATADPAQDMVLLNAPGQADVWRFYDSEFPVLLAPDSRPADANRVAEQLEAWTNDRRTVHALFWATDESDPGRLVESWLDTHLFKGQETWQNNVRYAQYFSGAAESCRPYASSYVPNGMPSYYLSSSCTPNSDEPEIASGTPYMLELRWWADAPTEVPYKVSVQLIQGEETVIAQHDSEPAGGSRPTTSWQHDELISDRHAVLVPIGAIPGQKRVQVVMYDPASGERVSPVFPLTMTVTLPETNPPIELLPMDAIVDRRMGGVDLLGYSQYKKDFGHAPETPLAPGDTLRLTLFWQAPNPLPENWQPDQQVTLRLGGTEITAPLANAAYATELWQPGQIVRGEFDLPYNGTSDRVTLSSGDAALPLGLLP